ncbi:MAG: amidohydrolase, partial [Pirellula sp.]
HHRNVLANPCCVLILGWTLACSIPNVGRSQESEIADLVILNGDIHTMDEKNPTATSVAVLGNRILAVGSEIAIRKHIGPNSQRMDAQGKLLLPGFNDSHVHFLQGGQQLSSVQLRDAISPAVFQARMAEFAKKVERGQWITGGDWDHENWPSGELPRKDWIDDATAEIGVFITRLDGHMGLANSYALRLAGIGRNTPDPPGGLIVRDSETGEATGVLKDAAMGLVTRTIPPISREAKLNAAKTATQYAASVGVTSVQDMSGAGNEVVYRELQRNQELKTRIYSAAPLPNWRRSADSGLRAATGDAWIRQGALKGFADGSLGSTTALFFDPYVDEPRTRGLPSDEMLPAVAMYERIRDADKASLQVMIHAIGDKANDEILSFYERVSNENGTRDRRFRIEHAQHLRLPDIARFVDQKIIASMQPYHCADDGRWALKRIGPERAKGTYAFRTLLDAGVTLAFGSDWNVAPLDPIQGIAAAVTRRTLDGKHPNGWVPEQKITVQEAVYAYTAGSAFAEFAERDKGKIVAGMLADMIVLSENIYSASPDNISNAKVVMTMVDGKVVYQSDR